MPQWGAWTRATQLGVLLFGAATHAEADAADCFPDRPLGQDYSAVESARGLAAADMAWLLQLSENAQYRSNIGFTNASTQAIAVKLSLYDGSGAGLASSSLELAAGEWLQVNRPLASFAQLLGADGACARVTVKTGAGLVAYASVVDKLTNDPTTVFAVR